MDLTQVNMPVIDSIEALDQLDLTSVDTSRPLFKPETTLKMRLDRMEVKPSKTAGKEHQKNLYVTLKLEEAAQSEDGKTVHPGFTQTEVFGLTPSENFDPRENIARLQLCFSGVKGPFKGSELVGKVGLVRMKIEDDPKYGKRNRVGTWIQKKPDATPSL